MRLIGILGGAGSLYAIAMLLFDGFGDELESPDIARFGLGAIAGALLAHAVRRGGRPPWARGRGWRAKQGWGDANKDGEG